MSIYIFNFIIQQFGQYLVLTFNYFNLLKYSYISKKQYNIKKLEFQLAKINPSNFRTQIFIINPIILKRIFEPNQRMHNQEQNIINQSAESLYEMSSTANSKLIEGAIHEDNSNFTFGAISISLSDGQWRELRPQHIVNDQVISVDDRVWASGFRPSAGVRFPYMIHISHCIAKRIPSYSALQTDIKQVSSISSMIIQPYPSSPNQPKGLIISLSDPNRLTVQKAFSYLLQYTTNIQNQLKPISQYSTTVLLPRMLVPVVIGKQGWLLKRVKAVGRADICIYGPYVGNNYQDIVVTSAVMDHVCRTCYILYEIAYTALKKQQIQISKKWIAPHECSIGLYLSPGNYDILQTQYGIYVQNLKKSYRIATQSFKISKNKQKRKGFESQYQDEGVIQQIMYVYMMSGRMDLLKVYLGALVQLFWFQEQHQMDLVLVLGSQQAKSITGHNGKILRDISSKCAYCYIEVLQKCGQYNRLIVRGNTTNKIRAACIIIQYLCFQEKILLHQSAQQAIDYEQIIKDFIQKQDQQIQHNDDQTGELDNQKKNKRIKKRKDKNKKKERQSQRKGIKKQKTKYKIQEISKKQDIDHPFKRKQCRTCEQNEIQY